jgi:hypothetical protein
LHVACVARERLDQDLRQQISAALTEPGYHADVRRGRVRLFHQGLVLRRWRGVTLVNVGVVLRELCDDVGVHSVMTS